MNILGKPRSKLLLLASHVFSDASGVSPSDYLSGVDGHSIHHPSRLSTDWSATGRWCHMSLQCRARHAPHGKAATPTSVLGGKTSRHRQ